VLPLLNVAYAALQKTRHEAITKSIFLNIFSSFVADRLAGY
jgi:hypothetical protein